LAVSQRRKTCNLIMNKVGIDSQTAKQTVL